MKAPISTQQELNRMSKIELDTLFNRVSGIALSKDYTEPEKATGKNSLEEIKRGPTSRRP